MSPSSPPDYDPASYWNERLDRDFSLSGVGHVGLGLSFNKWAYAVRRAVLLRATRDHLIPFAGARILELAFGTGFYLDLWREKGADHVAGFDISDVAVRAARERFSELSWQFEKADISAPLPVDPGGFDIATAFDVLFHVVDEIAWNGALDNLRDALRPAGHLLILEKVPTSPRTLGAHVKLRSLTTYREALEKRGFELLSIRPVFFLMSPSDLPSTPMPGAKALRWLVEAPYRLGRLVGMGEAVGGAMGASLYGPELVMGKLLATGPSTKLLVARKR